ncbi:MAG TPA: YidB family protein [Acidisphaera sp.]|nr:YidB family protein [Acidisphaera sp.]
MSLFGDIAGSLLGQGGESAIAGHLMQAINEQGGVAMLVQRFEQAGMSGVIATWVGTGPNASVAPDQLHGALGSDLVQQLAQRTGLPIEQLMPLIAQHLPGLIDRATPDGQVPAATAPAAGDQSDQ